MANRNIFRLFAVLCLFFIIKSGATDVKKEIPASEYGVGGGALGLYNVVPLIGSQDGIYSASLEYQLDGFETETAVVEELESISKIPFLFYENHIVQSGENISTLARNFGLHQGTLISVNKITNTRLLQAGGILKIPNQDGILHTVKTGETLRSISESHRADPQAILVANELFSERIRVGTDLFIPGATLDWTSIQEINGDLFIWPIRGAITSHYGYRRSPFTGRREFHNGMDIRGSTGTPVRAAMAGRVSRVGYDNIFGNFVIINHHSGYRTLYGHLSVIRTRTGAYVGTGERIGDVGNTGRSTGPHLHFTVYKDGATVNPRYLMR